MSENRQLMELDPALIEVIQSQIDIDLASMDERGINDVYHAFRLMSISLDCEIGQVRETYLACMADLIAKGKVQQLIDDASENVKLFPRLNNPYHFKKMWLRQVRAELWRQRNAVLKALAETYSQLGGDDAEIFDVINRLAYFGKPLEKLKSDVDAIMALPFGDDLKAMAMAARLRVESDAKAGRLHFMATTAHDIINRIYASIEPEKLTDEECEAIFLDATIKECSVYFNSNELCLMLDMRPAEANTFVFKMMGALHDMLDDTLLKIRRGDYKTTE